MITMGNGIRIGGNRFDIIALFACLRNFTKEQRRQIGRRQIEKTISNDEEHRGGNT